MSYYKEDEICSFVEKLGWPFRQINGQRLLGPQKEVESPGPGTELIIKHLPVDFFENKLYPLCAKFGDIYSIRILVNFNNETRGVAFVKYKTVESASMAVQLLNRYKITNDHTLKVNTSIDNVKLYIGGIPGSVTEQELLELLYKEVNGVLCAKFGPIKASKSSKYAFVQFKSHREAALARKYFRENETIMWGKNIKIDWAKPEMFLNSEYITNNKRIFIQNLAPFISVNNVARIVLSMISSEYIERVYIKSGYGFIHLSSHRAAEYLLRNLKGIVIGNLPLHVEWARPASKEEILLSNYKSVPYEMIKERRRRLYKIRSPNEYN